MAHFNPHFNTSLVVDAGPVDLGAILVQDQPDGSICPYASRSLTAQERRYSQTEKEALAVVGGCEQFHLYLSGKKFTILTDHQPLKVLYTHNGKPSPRILCSGYRVMIFSFNI